jgi:hypothetical protein
MTTIHSLPSLKRGKMRLVPAKRAPKSVSLLPTSGEAALYFGAPSSDDLCLLVALNAYRERTGRDIAEFQAGMELLWAHKTKAEVNA